MVSFAFFDYRIEPVAIFWGAPASLDSGIIGCFFPCFLMDARPLNSIAVLFVDVGVETKGVLQSCSMQVVAFEPVWRCVVFSFEDKTRTNCVCH
jgi:hypothetical protein